MLVIMLSALAWQKDIYEYKYELKSKDAKERYDSLYSVYSKQIDSLESIIDSTDIAIDSISLRINNRGKLDSTNYERIKKASPDSAYGIIREYLDSISTKR